MEEQLKKISIRARMALGITCLVKVFDHFTYSDPILQLLIDRLIEFVEKDRLDVWENRIKDVAPSSILDEHLDNDLTQYETIGYNELISLKRIYEKMPSNVTDLIDDVINIGESNLYGGVGSYSANSLNALLSVLNTVKMFNIAMPDLGVYSSSPFSENGGWGFVRPISTFSIV